MFRGEVSEDSKTSTVSSIGKEYSLLNGATSWHSCSGVPRGCVNRIRLWPPRRDYHLGVLFGAGGTRRSDWPARVLANDVIMRIDR